MSDSVRPQRRQPTRLHCPWDSLGKNTGAGYHFLLQCMKVKSESEVAQSCPTLSDLSYSEKKNPSTLLSLPVNTLLLSYPTEVCCKSCYTCYFSFISHLILNPITSSFLPPQLWNYFLYIYQSFVNEIDKHLVMRKDVLIQYWVKKVAYKA